MLYDQEYISVLCYIFRCMFCATLYDCVSAGSLSAVTADGILFAHPLHHLGKTRNDLPVLAIDSFRHMYLFPNFEDIK